MVSLEDLIKFMVVLSKQQTRAELEKQAKRWLFVDYKAEKISYLDVATYVYILTELTSVEQMQFMLELWSADFPTLAGLLEKQEAVVREDFAVEVKEVVKDMIVDNPAKAAELAEIAMRPGMNVEQLVELVPEAQAYLENLNKDQ